MKAYIYIDDDAMGATMTIADYPCSVPNCVHADVRLSAGTLACMLEYIERGIASAGKRGGWVAVRRQEEDNAALTFMPSRVDVSLYEAQGCSGPSRGLQCTFYVQREHILIDMSNEWGGLEDDGDTVGPAEVRAAIEDIE